MGNFYANAVATGFQYIEAGEIPDGLDESDLRRVG
jgi:hypothetical protein